MMYLVKRIEIYDGSIPGCWIEGIYTNADLARARMREIWEEENYSLHQDGAVMQTVDRCWIDGDGDLVMVEVLAIEQDTPVSIFTFEEP